jgi:hypothetical protein
MTLIRPRLTDYHNILLAQEEIDFAIPYLDEDLPLCVDPFLLWKSPSQQDNALHSILIDSFNHLGYLVNHDNSTIAEAILINASECSEVGLGFSKTRKGLKIGQKAAQEILSLFKLIPEVKQNGFIHFETIQLYVDQISKDRISNIACSFLKSFLIDYTIEQCNKYGIPLSDVTIQNVYDPRSHNHIESEDVTLPSNPETNEPILLVPTRWLRKSPWINGDVYVSEYFPLKVLKKNKERPEKGEILNFNRQNYGIVQAFIREREQTSGQCVPDPLFSPIPVLSAKRKLNSILKLPTGTTDKADKKFESLIAQLMVSMLFPHLDFAAEQSRTESGVLIRDLVFYNNRSIDFMQDIYKDYGSRQIVMEIKNVKAIEREHINQLNRYLANEFGRFGILLTRNPLPKSMFKNTIDLWAGQRCCIIALDDQDLKTMYEIYENKQRIPIEVIKKKYIEFTRACPS